MYFKREWLIPSGIGVGSFGVGLGLGYLWAKHNAEKVVYEYETVTEREVEPGNEQLAIDFDEKINKAFDELRELRETVLAKAGESVIDDDEEDDDEEVERVEVNVFPNEDTSWNWDDETRSRDSEKPYVIHREEYFSSETDHRQSSLTWYEGDDILVDEHDVPIYNAAHVVGEMKFGHGSGDANVVYIRNETLDAEYEILRHTGHYQIEVLGAQIEHEYEDADDDLAHSVRRFRSD